MNNPQSPLIPQGSMLEQKNKGRARVKLAVFFVLAVHGIGLLVLLMQGCRREEPQAVLPAEEATNAPPVFVEPTNAPSVDTTPAFVEPSTNVTAPPIVEPPVVAPVAPAGTTEYTVVKGDTFSSIASKSHVTVKALMEANPGVEPTKLQINQKIQIPAPGTGAGTTSAAAPAPAANGTTTYTVKSGDTLSRIASQHNTTVKAIRAANNLATDRITVGQKLKIPVKTPAPAPAPVPEPVPSTLTPVPTTPAPGQ